MNGYPYILSTYLTYLTQGKPTRIHSNRRTHNNKNKQINKHHPKKEVPNDQWPKIRHALRDLTWTAAHPPPVPPT